MSIASELEDLATNLQAAKDAVTTKGGTVGDTGLAGLASEITSIPSGGGGEYVAPYGNLAYYDYGKRRIINIDGWEGNLQVELVDSQTFEQFIADYPPVYGDDQIVIEYRGSSEGGNDTWFYEYGDEFNPQVMEWYDEESLYQNTGIQVTWELEEYEQRYEAQINVFSEEYVDYSALAGVRYLNTADDLVAVGTQDDKILGIPKTAIGSYTAGSSVTSFPNYFLYRCSYLETVDLTRATNVQSFGTFFLNTNSTLTEVTGLTIPNGITAIPRYFLANLPKFNEPITFPSTVTSIGDGFLNCDSANGEFNQPITIPSTVTAIGNQFLTGQKDFDYEVVVPQSVTSIDGGFLWKCRSLTHAPVLHNGITSIGNYYLAECSKLNDTVEIPSAVTTIGTYFLYNDIKFNQPISIPSTVTSIGQGFLKGCAVFNHPITMPSNVSYIQEEFLSGCKALNSTVTLPSNATQIKNSFMSDCHAFNQPLTIPSGVTTIGSYFLGTCVNFNQPITLPNVLTTIGIGFLSTCQHFDQPLVIPDSVTQIQNAFLSGCIRFNSSLTLSANYHTVFAYFMTQCHSFNQPLDLSHITSLGANFLEGCGSFAQTLTIPSGCEVGRQYFMYNCENFTNLVMNGTVNSVTTHLNYALSTSNQSALCYQTGITITGTNRSLLLNLPNRTTNPYRKLIDGGA